MIFQSLRNGLGKVTLAMVISVLSQLDIQAQPLRVPAIFSNHMVLQRDIKIPVWGTAKPMQKIKVILADQVVDTEADQNGNWFCRLDGMAAGGPYEMSVEGKKTLSFSDIYIGEVWLCSGQSNMTFPLNQSMDGHPANLKFQHQNVRLIKYNPTVPLRDEEMTSRDVRKLRRREYLATKGWEVATPASAASFSAVAIHFGQQLSDSLKVPIGLIQNAVGGSPTQSWINVEALSQHPQLKSLLEEKEGETWLEVSTINPWLIERAQANFASKRGAGPLDHPYAPSYLFEAGIKPIAPYAMRGVIWYQGESNATHPEGHYELFREMVSCWRRQWNQGEFPFYFVQLPSIGNRSRWPEFRASQQACLSIPMTAMAVTTDLGDSTDVHPKQKYEFGRRLAHIALKKSYGFQIISQGPRLVSHRLEQRRQILILDFDPAAGPIKTKDSLQVTGMILQGYINGGRAEVIRPVEQAKIDHSRIAVDLPSDMMITAVKYNWTPQAMGNLTNEMGLPVHPFKIEFPGNN